MTPDTGDLHCEAMAVTIGSVRCPLLIGRDDLLDLADQVQLHLTGAHDAQHLVRIRVAFQQLIADLDGVAIRSGQHCAHPLLQSLGVAATCRASSAFYNTHDEVEQFIVALNKARGLLA